MHFDLSTFALQTVNFAILVWLLHRFLYRPVLRIIDARRSEIEKQYAEGKAFEDRAMSRLAAVTAEHSAIAAEREAMLQQAATEGEKLGAERRAQAEREASALLTDAKKRLAAERAQALAEARRAALDLGADMAARLLAQIPGELRAAAWSDRIEQHLAALPEPERTGLSNQLVNGAHLRVVTAAPLTADAAEAWRSKLQRTLGGSIAIEFAVDPQLVAGADLHFPNAVLHLCWQNALTAMRAEIEADAHAH
jgi:F-type H+-transporting ATPase subunit b